MTSNSRSGETSADGKGIPSTPTGRLVLEYLDAINAGDRDGIREYITAHYDPSFLARYPSDLYINAYVDSLMGPYYESAGLGHEFHSMSHTEDGEIRALLCNKLTGSWSALCIPVAKVPSLKIVGMISLSPAAPPAGVPPSRKWNDHEIVERLDMCLAKLIEDDAFSGAVLLAKEGRPLFERAYGLANKSYQVPNQVDTKFNIASVGKVFTGVAIAQLTEQGKLSFGDRVSEYLLSDWLHPEVGERIQIQHLLTHTSGLGDYFGALYGQPSNTLYRTLDDYRPLVANQTLAFEPGTRWAYSNTGMLLLGVVIEQVSGESYFDYVREHIYKPAGMINTDAYEKDRPVPNRATGYIKEYTDQGVMWRHNLISRVMKGGPSGGSFSTVQDLLRFDVALRAHKLLGPEYTEIVLSPKPEINSPGYGYGFSVSQGDAGRIAGHGGDGSGINAQFRMYLELGYTVAVLSNYGPPAANVVHNVCHGMIVSP